MDESQKSAIIHYAESILAQDKSGHSMDHVNRVVRMAEKIAATENCDRFIVTAAAYLHDTVDDKIVLDETVAYEQLITFLNEIAITPDQIKHIIHIIKNLSFSAELEGSKKELTIEGKIVQDADRLDAMGALGIVRTIYYGGYKGNIIYDPAILPRNLANKREYRNDSTIINHFYEKLLLLNDRLNTEYGKKIGRKRQQFLEIFLEEFLDEWSN